MVMHPGSVTGDLGSLNAGSRPTAELQVGSKLNFSRVVDANSRFHRLPNFYWLERLPGGTLTHWKTPP